MAKENVVVRLVEQVVRTKFTLKTKEVSSLSIAFLSELTLTNTSTLVPAKAISTELMQTFASLETVVPLKIGSTTVYVLVSSGLVRAASEYSSMLNSHSVLSSPVSRICFVP